MTWQGFYLLCFLVGFVLALIGLLGGSVHLPHVGGLHHGTGFHGHAGAGGSGHGASGGGSALSPFNFATFMAFLAWFGGVGYLLTARGNLARSIILLLAVAAGSVGAGLVFGFLTKVLLKHEKSLEAADFEMVGVLGRVTVPIRVEGTGEIVYSQGGTRRSVGARSETGLAIARDCEVVVTRYEGGIACVRPFDELAASAEEGNRVS